MTVVTLLQTKKIPIKGPIIAIGKDFWEPLFKWMREELCYNHQTIKGENLDIFTLVDTPEEAFEIIKRDFQSKNGQG